LFHNTHPDEEIYDLADLTPQCGRKGDALKMFLGWTFYGKAGYALAIENAFETAEYLFTLLSEHPDIVMVSKRPLPCLQVCFYYAKVGTLSDDFEANGKITETIAQRLVTRGWMIDYAPGDQGKFFRAVVGRETRRETVEGLVKAIGFLAAELERT
jgi:glutamate decarboxylase